jgi:hypothetical protein
MADRHGDGILPPGTVADRTQRLTEIIRDLSYPNRRPRDAATLILIDRCRKCCSDAGTRATPSCPGASSFQVAALNASTGRCRQRANSTRTTWPA